MAHSHRLLYSHTSPVLGIYNIKEARQAFPEKDIASSKIALSSDEFTKLCDDIGASKYARSFQHGEIVCKYCWEDLTGFRNLVKQSIIDPQLEKLGCDLTFPDFSDLQYRSLDNSGFDKNVYINKINQHREKNLAKLHELDMQLLDELPSYSHQCMENALSPRQQARFINAKNSMKMDSTTSMAITEKILSEGLKNSIGEFIVVLSSRLNAVNEEDIVIEYTPGTQGCDVIIIIPTEETLDGNTIEKLFRRYVIDKPIEHPYGMPWHRTKNKATLSYKPSLLLENIDVDDSEGNIVIVARIGFKFE